jgi:hypothetical protein
MFNKSVCADIDSMKHFLLISLLAVVGCSGVNYLGSVGDTKFYAVHDSRLDGPNFNALVTAHGGSVTVQNAFAGPGLLTAVSPSVVSAAGEVGAADVFGTSLRPDIGPQTSVKATVSGTATGGKAVGTGGYSNATSTAKNNSDNSTVTNNDINKVNSDDSTTNNNQTNNVNVGK